MQHNEGDILARVNVETAAIAETRFFEFATEMGFQRHEAIGLLVLLWHDSQERLFIEGSRQEILSFIPLQKDKKENCFDALVKCQYLTAKDDRYEINGNRRHVNSLMALKKLKSKAGTASGIARRKQQDRTEREQVLNRTEQTSTEPSRNAMQHNSNQDSTIQNTTIQNNSKQSKTNNTLKTGSAQAASPKRDTTGKSAPLWQAYKEEYVKKWKDEPPPPDATIYSQLCVLLRNLGEKKAIEVIRYYFKMSDSYYIQNFHPIPLLVKQRHKIYSSMTTGLTHTKASMNRYEKTAQFQETLSLIDEGKI